MDESQLELERDRLAIHLQDATAQRLIEGLGVQLNLKPVFVSDKDLLDRELVDKIAILVADEEAARRFQKMPSLADHPGSGLRPALVAVFPFETAENTLLPQKGKGQQFDGVLVLP